MGRILIGNIKGPQGAQGIQGPQGPVGATGPMGPMPDLINNALATQAGMAALDAAMGKTLQDQITQLNSDILHSKKIQSGTYRIRTDNSYQPIILFGQNSVFAVVNCGPSNMKTYNPDGQLSFAWISNNTFDITIPANTYVVAISYDTYEVSSV